MKHETVCDCIDCRLERLYGDSRPPDSAIEFLGGCAYCAMTGYEDYPTGKVSCRRGHPPYDSFKGYGMSASSIDFSKLEVSNIFLRNIE